MIDLPDDVPEEIKEMIIDDLTEKQLMSEAVDHVMHQLADAGMKDVKRVSNGCHVINKMMAPAPPLSALATLAVMVAEQIIRATPSTPEDRQAHTIAFARLVDVSMQSIRGRDDA